MLKTKYSPLIIIFRLISLQYLSIYTFILGTILTWIPRPNGLPQSNQFTIEDDSWIKCDGYDTCSKGLFQGQTCFDLSDRVLVGAGKGGGVLALRDATLPDHAHAHNHEGTQSYSFSYSNSYGDIPAGMGGLMTQHGYTSTKSFTVDFSKMKSSEAFVSTIVSSDSSKSTIGNDLYSQHIRVQFIFKCY